MGGKRLVSFRGGDRSEYLAQYILSRFSFVIPFPRQEDFGVADFLCVLAKEDGTLTYPMNAFYVQIKSNEKDIIFDRDSAKWLSHFMDLPLLLCIVNKDESRLKIYSCWHIWSGLFRMHIPEKMTLVLNTKLPLEAETVIDQSKEIIIPLGVPIVNETIDEFENNAAYYHDILEVWLDIDKLNIARRSIGRIFSSGPVNWETNKAPTMSKNIYTFGPEYSHAEAALAPILTSLAHSYRHNKKKEELYAVIGMLQILRPHLDEHGIKFADNELLIDEDSC